MTDEKNLLLFEARIKELYTAANEKYHPHFTKFLTEEEQVRVKEIVSHAFHTAIDTVYGGYDGAERCMVGFFPEYAEKTEDSYPIKYLKVQGNKFYSFTHRDVLGSLMGLGIKRENIGDILVDTDTMCAYIVLSEDICEYVLTSLKSIGRSSASLTEVSREDIIKKEARFEEISDTVSSLRADAVLSSALNISREKASAVIASGIFSVNHKQVLKKDLEIKQNDLITVKGKGRFLVSEAGELTKKGRIRLKIKKYI